MTSSIVAKVLSLAGMTGSGVPSNSLAPNRDPSVQFADFAKSGETANPDIWESYNSVLTRPRTLEESLRVWDEMSHWDLIAAALSEITDEACQVDSMSPGLVWYECRNREAEEDINNMLQVVNTDEIMPSQVWHTAAYGNNFEKLDYAVGEGVVGMTAVHPMDIRRYWLERNRKCVGFRWHNHKPDKEGPFQLGQTTIERAKLKLNAGTGGGSTEDLFYPWDFMHIRRMHRSRISEHGQPMFEDAIGIYKKLRMAVDQMVVHRSLVQPDRYVVNIDVKDLPPTDQHKAVQRWKQSLRSKLSFGNGASGLDGQPEEFKSFYNALALDSILWMAKPRDFQHSIEKLAGTASVPDVFDIELLINLFFSILGMPKSWIGLGGEKEGGPVSGKALLAQDMRFLRKIKSIRKPIVNSYHWLGYFHLLLKGYDIASLELKVQMPPIGSLEDQMKLELLKSQAEVLDVLADVLEKYNLPREAMIDVVFKKYMRLPDDVVDAFMTALPAEAQAAEEGVKGARHGDMKKLMEDISRKLGPHSAMFKEKMEAVLSGSLPPTIFRKYKSPEQVLVPPIMQENDIIIAGYDQIDPRDDFKAKAPGPDSVTESFVTRRRTGRSAGYRSAMDAHIGAS